MTANYCELEWAAGFLEAEGCFTQASGHRTHGGVPEIVVGQVQRWPIDRLIELFGGNARQRPPRGRDQAIWCWGIYGKRAAELMRTLYPLMSAKRRREIDRAYRMPAERGKRLVNGQLVWARTLDRKDHCEHGHPYTPENTYYHGEKRSCRTCRNLWPRERRRRRREELRALGIELRTTRTWTIEDMRALAKKRGGACLSTKYINNYTKLHWRCGKGHEWRSLPKSLLQGTWCRWCSAKRKRAKQRLVTRH